MGKTIKLYSLLFLFLGAKSFSQHAMGTNPGPNSLGTVDIHQNLVDHATGRVNVNIPITEISTNDYKLPVHLNYSSSGLKVEAISSWIGMGWNLTAGGYISRVIYGYPDDADSDKRRGILNTTVMSDIPTINAGSASDKIDNFDRNNKDTQPDLFSLVLNGQKVDFVFDETKSIRTINNQDFRIQHFRNTNGELEKFWVWDSYGNKYDFEEIEITKETSRFKKIGHEGILVGDSETHTYNSAWYLKKITTATGNTIDFSYRTENMEYTLKTIEMAKICKNNDCNAYPTAGNFDPKMSSTFYVTAKVIQKISTPLEIIDFKKSANLRSDLKGSYALSEIVKSAVNSNFNQSYVFNTSFDQSSGTVDSQNPYINYRLKLNSIYLNGVLKNEFTYNTQTAPNRFSSEQDYWGYYNGNGQTSLIPNIYVYADLPSKTSFYPKNVPNSYILLPGADRSSNTAYTESGMLKSVKNETGNTIHFAYELNKFIHDNITFNGNGLRVKQVEFKNPGEYNYTRQFSYDNNNVTTGFVPLLPSFSHYNFKRHIRYLIGSESHLRLEAWDYKYKIVWEAAPGSPIPFPYFISEGPSNWTPFQYALYRTLRFATSINNANEYAVNYLKVTESFQNQNIEHNFAKNDINTDLPNNPELHNNSIERVLVPNALSPASHLTSNELDADFPFVRNYMRNWEQVTPVNIIYKNGANTVKKEEFIYEVQSKINQTNGSTTKANKVFGLKYDYVQGIKYFATAGEAVYTPYQNEIACYSKYPIIIESDKKLVTHRTIEYRGTEQLTNETKYTYLNGLTRTVKQTNSKGLDHQTEMTYPDDLKQTRTVTDQSGTYSVDNIYKIMVNANMIDYPVQVINKLDSKVTGASITNYEGIQTGVNSSYPLKFSEMKLNINNPVSDYQPASPHPNFNVGTRGLLTVDSRLEKTVNYNKYDEKANLVETTAENGNTKCFIWGYKKTRIIAEIENVSYASIPTATIANLQALSDADNTNCAGTDCNEHNLRVALSNLRTSFPNALIKTYTHDTLLGITSVSDARGYTYFYEYDSFKRLISVKDAEGKIMSKNEYNFHNN
jgi:YD repeat-containing protein